MNSNKISGKVCPYCAESAKLLFSVPDINQNMSDEIFDYYRCHGCGLVFLSPIPKNIHEYYGQAYSAYQTTGDIEKNATDYDLSKVEIVRQHIKGDKLLEIGPGNGTFSYLAKKHGFVVDAIEMDQNCSNYLIDHIKIRNVFNSSDIAGTLENIQERYDVVVMWHVLEHLLEPWNVLQAISNVLAPHGVIIIAAPNPNAFQFRLFKKYWKHVDAPRHTIFIPARILAKEMEKAGLEKTLITTNDKVSSVFNSPGWFLNTLNNFFSVHPIPLVSWVLNRSRINNQLYKLIRIFERTEGSGNAYLAIFRKSNAERTKR